jgi:hypothetical protein
LLLLLRVGFAGETLEELALIEDFTGVMDLASLILFLSSNEKLPNGSDSKEMVFSQSDDELFFCKVAGSGRDLNELEEEE